MFRWLIHEGLNATGLSFFQKTFNESFSAIPRLTLRMNASMKPEHDPELQTCSSLLNKLKAGDDSQSWQEFYRTYGGLIRFFLRIINSTWLGRMRTERASLHQSL